MLSSYRVIDLSNERGIFCGYVLAHLGAEVIAIESPGGCAARRQAPFAGDSGEPDDSLWWWAYGRGRQSLTLDLNTPAGRERCLEIATEADFVIESFEPGYMATLGLDYTALSERNPRLIAVSITPFGQSGPKAHWPATDLTIWAASGAHSLAGDDDRAPVRTTVPQAFLHAGADAAGAALVALQERHKSGRGQHIDVSAQQSSAQAALSAMLGAPNRADLKVERMAGGLKEGMPIRLTWPCRDGYVAITLLFGPAFTGPNRRLLAWLHEHGACSAEDVETDWGAELAAMVTKSIPPDAYFELCAKIERFTLVRTQNELFEEGLARGLYIAPARDVSDLLEEPHFVARDFWTEIDHPTCPGLRVPGPFAKLSATALAVPGPAPRLADAGEVLPPHAPTAALPADPSSDSELPLAGLKVLDFMWVIAGPFFTRVLADYGATVVKVESTTRIEPARGAGPFVNGEPNIEGGIGFLNFNAGKLGVTIDPSNPAGREVILDLVRWADVVTESFSPKAMKGWQLSYETLREVNPSIIMLSSCLMGQTGPRASVAGYGNMAAALTGFYDLTGWPDRSPAGPYLAYTDAVSPRFMLASLLAAMEHRRDTGEGQHIDVSQAEAAIHFLAPALLDFQVNGRVWSRMGNRDLQLAPHGVYPASGADRWVAIACQSDSAWLALCRVMGLELLAKDPVFRTAPGRLACQEDLDRALSAWTSSREERAIEAALIGAGVAAHVVQNSPECLADPQLRHRGHFARVSHSLHKEVYVEGSRFALSRTPARVERAGPTLGEHNGYVLAELLGYDEDRMAEIVASGGIA